MTNTHDPSPALAEPLLLSWVAGALASLDSAMKGRRIRMDGSGSRLDEIFLELGDLWFSCGRTKITVTEVLGAHGLKTIHRGMTREWAQTNRAHYGMTLVDIEDLETAGLGRLGYFEHTRPTGRTPTHPGGRALRALTPNRGGR